MDLSLSEEQILLRDAARDFLEKECPESHVRDMETTSAAIRPTCGADGRAGLVRTDRA